MCLLLTFTNKLQINHILHIAGTVSLILFVGGVFVLILMQCLWVFGWIKVIRKTQLHKEYEGVSVVIAARNEAPQLQKFLPAILTQTHPLYEVIVVLDRCTDESNAIVGQLQQTHPHLQTVEIQETPPRWAGKKYALTQGIAQAKYDILLFVDADCAVSHDWVKRMQACFRPSIQVVLGIGLYFYEKTLLNTFIRFETFHTAFQYIGAAGCGVPYMGVGRNIAYRKSYFWENKGFEAFKERLSGDDDLWVNAYANAQNVAVCLDDESVTYSLPKTTFRSWLKQKFRHVSAAPRYSLTTQLMLTAYHFAHIGLYFFGLLTIFFQPFLLTFIVYAFIIRLLISWVIFLYIQRHIKDKKMLYLYPLLDIMFVLYNAIVVPLGFMFKPVWN